MKARVKIALTEQPGRVGTTVHSLPLEIGRERPFTIWSIEESLVPVGTECSRKHTDIAEDTLRNDKLIRGTLKRNAHQPPEAYQGC